MAGYQLLTVLDLQGRVKAQFDYQGAAYALAFSPDGQTLAVGTWLSQKGKETIGLYDLKRRQIVKKLGPFEKPVFAVTFTPDGKKLVAALKDKAIPVFKIK